MSRRKMVLVYGEDRNDGEVLTALLGQLLPADYILRAVRDPIILNPSKAGVTKRKANANRLKDSVDIFCESNDVKFVVVHNDCDAMEPAHLTTAAAMIKEYQPGIHVPVVAATPAWEMEAWLMLFPDAIASFRSCWRRLNMGGRNVGHVANAKEHLRRSLRSGRRGCGDYTELHAGPIAREVRLTIEAAKLLGTRSASFAAWVDAIEKQVAQG